MTTSICRLAIMAGMLMSTASAQQAENALTTVNWEPNPVIHQPDARYKNESAVVLSDLRRVEYVDQGETMAEYRTVHKIIHINDDRGIEAFNRVYLDVFDNADIRDIKARTILPNGKIIEVDKRNIKEVQEKQRVYKIFAMEGVEKGCEVEFYYTYKAPFAYFGREILQSSFPVVMATAEVISPSRLIFNVKPYNSTSAVSDTVIHEKRIASVLQQHIDAAEEEKYAAYTAMLNRIEYKLSYNTSRSADVRLFTWSELAKLIHAAYSTFTTGELKKVAELVRKEGWEKAGTEENKIIQVERFVKTNFSTRDDIGGVDAENVEKVIKNKIASEKGITRLYSAIFTKLGIVHEYVVTGSREAYELDKDFENWSNAENILLHFPSVKKFVCPTMAEIRYPWVNPMWTSTNALFCKPTVIGNFATALGVVKAIPSAEFESTQNNIDATLTFNSGIDTLVISTTNSYTGYTSVYIRAAYNFGSKDDREAMSKHMAKSGTGSEHIISTTFRDTEFDNLTNNRPFVFDANVKSVELIEKAGSKVLVKIGEIIGQQVAMYEDKPRKMPIHIDYPHVMKRTITFNIPEGYKLLNPDVLVLKSVYDDNGERTMGFESNYNIDKNILTVSIVEDYRKVWYPRDQYAPFQKIINSAADFNKAVLVLQKM